MKERNLLAFQKKGFPIPELYSVTECLKFENKLFIVRSSGSTEDSIEIPASGIFKSVPNVKGKLVPEAITEVMESFHSKRAKAYMEIKKVTIEPGYFIQEMVDAKASAIVFIEDNYVSVIGANGSCENITNGNDTFTISPETKGMNLESLFSLIEKLKNLGNLELEMVLDHQDKWWIVQIKYKGNENV